jgi:hypothetical protein
MSARDAEVLRDLKRQVHDWLANPDDQERALSAAISALEREERTLRERAEANGNQAHLEQCRREAALGVRRRWTVGSEQMSRNMLEFALRSQMTERFEEGVATVLELFDALGAQRARADRAEAALATKDSEIATLHQQLEELTGGTGRKPVDDLMPWERPEGER